MTTGDAVQNNIEIAVQTKATNDMRQGQNDLMIVALQCVHTNHEQ